MKRWLILPILLAAIAVFAGTERINLSPVFDVRVFSMNDKGEWKTRMVKAHGFDDADIFVCFEFKNNEMMECLVVMHDGGETEMVKVKMLEQKT